MFLFTLTNLFLGTEKFSVKKKGRDFVRDSFERCIAQYSGLSTCVYTSVSSTNPLQQKYENIKQNKPIVNPHNKQENDRHINQVYKMVSVWKQENGGIGR